MFVDVASDSVERIVLEQIRLSISENNLGRSRSGSVFIFRFGAEVVNKASRASFVVVLVKAAATFGVDILGEMASLVINEGSGVPHRIRCSADLVIGGKRDLARVP